MSHLSPHIPNQNQSLIELKSLIEFDPMKEDDLFNDRVESLQISALSIMNSQKRKLDISKNNLQEQESIHRERVTSINENYRTTKHNSVLNIIERKHQFQFLVIDFEKSFRISDEEPKTDRTIINNKKNPMIKSDKKIKIIVPRKSCTHINRINYSFKNFQSSISSHRQNICILEEEFLYQIKRNEEEKSSHLYAEKIEAEALEKKLSLLRKEASESYEIIKILDTKNEEENEITEFINHMIDHLKKEGRKSREETETKMVVLTEMKNKYGIVENTIYELNQKNMESHNIIKELTKELSEVNGEIGGICQQITNMEFEIKDFKIGNEGLVQEIEPCKRRIRCTESEIQNCMRIIEAKERILSDISSDLSDKMHTDSSKLAFLKILKKYEVEGVPENDTTMGSYAKHREEIESSIKLVQKKIEEEKASQAKIFDKLDAERMKLMNELEELRRGS